MALTLFPKNAADVCAAKRTEKNGIPEKSEIPVWKL